MTLWFVFALMTVAAVFAVLWPLGRSQRSVAKGGEAAVYRDQLTEVERDAASGLIAPAEAEAARVEISRRLLAAADADEHDKPIQSNRRLRRAVAVVALVGLPILAVAFYLPLGSPQLDDFPLAERSKQADPSQPLGNMVTQVEQHLQKNPTDGRGWAVLAPVLARLGRYDDAAQAYRNSITYNGDSAERRADLGEVLMMAANGVVTSDANAEFERGLAIDANDPKSRYFVGVAAEQDGRPQEAASIWRNMLETAPPNAPWIPTVQAALTRVGGSSAPALSDDTIAAAKGMSAADRDGMIHGMVDRLASRLRQNGDDVEGWLRLVRAYMVLGDRDSAKNALTEARQAVANDEQRLRQLNEGLKNLGLDG